MSVLKTVVYAESGLQPVSPSSDADRLTELRRVLFQS